ncbi:hypothetical protein T492DRAFT_1100460 [Pavlovales sp. CCMP2436]|nr:hypothetical protein T492DRAFT_1100460 [Pavlovales sp. CCMP2436]
MGRVGSPRGTSFEDAKLTWAEVQASLERGTVVFNYFGAHEKSLAQMCLGAVHAFGLPCNLNLYITRAGQPLSAPPHTDRQDVLIVQTQGVKHWRVYAPPEPALRPGTDPLARGKSSDRLELCELGAPLLEVDLLPGQTLYIPAAFPHTTSTSEGGAAGQSEPSVHLTLNVDSHIWCLTYEAARKVALARVGEAPDGLDVRALPLGEYLDWQDTLPVGFRSPSRSPSSAPAADEAAAAAEAEATEVEGMARSLAERACAAQPGRWESADAAASALELGACARRLQQHYWELLDVQRRLYLDSALELTPTPHSVSLFRVKPYLAELEGTMETLTAWANLPPGSLVGEPAAAAAPVAKPAKAKPGKGKGKGKGFGG